MPREQTYIMIKPDGVQRGLVGDIIARFEKKGFKLSALKMMSPSKSHLETHYVGCVVIIHTRRFTYIYIYIHS